MPPRRAQEDRARELATARMSDKARAYLAEHKAGYRRALAAALALAAKGRPKKDAAD